jgi:hydrogenase expression/formation protein HypC
MCLGIPGRVVRITDPARQLAMVDVSGVAREVNLACIVGPDHPLDACVGDWVLVHVGFAMAKIDEVEAQLTLDQVKKMGSDYTNEIDAFNSSQIA